MDGGMEARPRYFLACVKVSVSSLSYHGRPDPKEKKDKIDKLLLLFKKDCNRADPDNFINAVIRREIFESMCSDDRHSSRQFGDWRQAPQLSSLVNMPAGIKLAYGDGYSRLEACKMRFHRNQKEHWWVVNLIDQDIGQGYLSSQIYRNSRSTANPTGVEIRNYLNLSADVGQAEASQIESSLSTSSRKGLKAIRTRSDLDKALVALGEIPGLWVSLKGGLNRTSLLGWDYENTHGLKDVYIKWLPILRDGHRFIDVDAETVENLGARVPGRSATDRQYVTEQMENKLLFPAETDLPTRERLKTRILSIKTLIPTLKTYSWDTLHLRELGTILRLLLSADDFKDGPRNIRSALRDIWEEPETGSAVLVEDLEDGVFSKVTVTSRTVDIFEMQLQSLVLHVMRNYTKLGGFSPKTRSGETKVQPEKTTITDLHRFAEIARTLGFRSVQYMMTPNEALRQDCENFVKKLKPRDLWEYDMAHVVDCHCRVQHGLKTKSQVIEVQDDLEVRLSQRFGRPITAVLDGSARNLFLRHLSSAVTETSGVTSTFVRMEFVRRFWDPVRVEVGDFSDVGMVRINSLEVKSLESPSVYSDDGIADEWRLREEQEKRSVSENLQTAHNQIQRLETQLEQQKEQIHQYTSEMSQSHRELGELRKDNEKKSAHIDNLERRAKADKSMITKLSERDENLGAKEEVYLKRIQELDQQTSRLLDEQREEEQGVQAMRNQASEKETEVEGLKSRLKETEFLVGDNNNLKEVLQSQAKQLQQLKNEQLALKQKEVREMQAVRNQVSEKETEVEGLKSRLKEAEFLVGENNVLKEDLQSQAEQLQQLRKDIYTKNEQLASLQDRRRMEQYLEEQIKGLIKEINDEIQKVESTENQIKQITERLDLLKTSNEQSKDFNRDYYNTAKFKFTLGKLQGEIKLRKEKIPPLKKKLTNTRYELLGLKEGEALFYERHPTTREIISQTPTRIPLKDLYAQFNNLKKVSDQYRVLCKRKGNPVTLAFNDFHEWQICLADPPVIDDATFYLEPLSLKRKAAHENFAASKRVRGYTDDGVY